MFQICVHWINLIDWDMMEILMCIMPRLTHYVNCTLMLIPHHSMCWQLRQLACGLRLTCMFSGAVLHVGASIQFLDPGTCINWFDVQIWTVEYAIRPDSTSSAWSGVGNLTPKLGSCPIKQAKNQAQWRGGWVIKALDSKTNSFGSVSLNMTHVEERLISMFAIFLVLFLRVSHAASILHVVAKRNRCSTFEVATLPARHWTSQIHSRGHESRKEQWKEISIHALHPRAPQVLHMCRMVRVWRLERIHQCCYMHMCMFGKFDIECPDISMFAGTWARYIKQEQSRGGGLY